MANNLILDDVTYGTTGWNGLVQSNFEAIEDFINQFQLASVVIDCQITTKQTIFTVPTGKVFIPTKLIIERPSASLAGLVDADFGAGAGADDWLQQISLAAFTATTDYGVLKQPEQAAGPPIVLTKKTINVATDVWGIKINTGSTGVATVTVHLFGFLIDA